MAKFILYAVTLSAALLFAGTSTAQDLDLCVEKAALKIVKRASGEQSGSVLRIEYLDAEFLGYTEDRKKMIRILVLWQSYNRFREHFWLLGDLYVDGNCCRIEFNLRDLSSNLGREDIPETLGCIYEDDEQMGRGPGKPFSYEGVKAKRH